MMGDHILCDYGPLGWKFTRVFEIDLQSFNILHDILVPALQRDVYVLANGVVLHYDEDRTKLAVSDLRKPLSSPQTLSRLNVRCTANRGLKLTSYYFWFSSYSLQSMIENRTFMSGTRLCIFFSPFHRHAIVAYILSAGPWRCVDRGYCVRPLAPWESRSTTHLRRRRH